MSSNPLADALAEAVADVEADNCDDAPTATAAAPPAAPVAPPAPEAAKPAVTITGSLAGAALSDTESESDSDSDSEPAPARAVAPAPAFEEPAFEEPAFEEPAFEEPAPAALSDSDEEIEFGEGAAASLRPSKAPKPSKPPVNPLADALGEAVADIEDGGGGGGGDADDDDDAFGIAYKPAPRSDQLGYTLPSGPAFADEREFVKDLETSEVTAAGTVAGGGDDDDDDDEFGFDDDETEPAAAPVDVAAKRAELERQRAEQEAALVAELQQADDDDTEPDNALQQLHAVYRAGLGDASVAEGADDATPVDAVSVGAPLGALAEDDEAAFEQAEEAADRAAAAAASAAAAEAEAHAAEWAVVDGLRGPGPAEEAEESAAADEGPAGAAELISYAEALRWFTESGELERHRDAIVATDFPGGMLGAVRRPRLKAGAGAGAEAERDTVFLLAKTAYDPAAAVHVRMVRTIYRRLMGTSLPPPAQGPHWEDVGFQGTNPGTDLRDTGVLSLLQLLALLERDLPQAIAMLRLSQHEVNHWPLACVSINFTLSAMQALRSGALYKACNEAGGVLRALNEFHAALCFDYYVRLREAPLEMFALVIQATKDAAAKAKPGKLIERLRKDERRRGALLEASGGDAGGEFTAEAVTGP